MAKYSKEQRDRAMDLYIRYERCAADVDWLQCIRQSDEGTNDMRLEVDVSEQAAPVFARRQA